MPAKTVKPTPATGNHKGGTPLMYGSWQPMPVSAQDQIANGLHQLLPGSCFQHEGIGAGLAGCRHHLKGVVHAEHDDFDGRGNATDLAGRLQAVHDGHGDVQDHRVWGELPDLVDGFEAVFGLAADLELGFSSQSDSYPSANSFVIIGE